MFFLPALGKQMQLCHILFTEPWKGILEVPCRMLERACLKETVSIEGKASRYYYKSGK